MKRRRYHQPTSASAKRRLLATLLLFLAALSVPVYLLMDRVYAQLDNERFFNASREAEQWVGRIDQALQSALQKEQDRPIAEYRFFNVLENRLLNAAGLKFSPLSELPPKTDVAGVVGYFQIDADGSFQIPALPDLEQGRSSVLSPDELAKRLALKERLKMLLKTGEMGKSRDRVGAPLPKDEESRALNENRQDYVVEQTYDVQSDEIGKLETKPDAVSKEQLKEWNIDSGPWEQERKQKINPEKKKSRSPEYKTRKETVKLPEQSIAKSLQNIFRSTASSIHEQASESDLKDRNVSGDSAQAPSVNALEAQNPVIFSFESEVGPFQMLPAAENHLFFFRHVWYKQSRLTQGFIVDSNSFWQAVLKPILNDRTDSSLLLTYQGRLLQRFGDPGSRQEILLFRSALLPPFQGVEAIVNAKAIGLAPGKRVVDLLAISLILILGTGMLVLYRLGAKQIELSWQQKNFISSVSHELKTPLTSIRMYGEMLRSGWIADESKKKSYYDYIFFESERLSRLIANVLQLAKLENGQVKVELSSIAVEDLLHRVSEKIAAQADASGFKINSWIENELAKKSLQVNEDAFYQIVINLVDNAVKFASSASRKEIDVGFRVGKRKQEVIFYVRDYGPGIKKGQLKKIFQLFHRGEDEMTRTTPGTGIGLSLARQLAESMNARLTAENKQPGVIFQLELG